METAQQLEQPSIAKELHTAVRHSAIYGFGGVLAKVIGFCMLPFYTHYLSPVDYGVLEILDLSMSLFGMVFNMGMAAALLRYYAAAQTVKDKQRVVGTGFLFTVATGGLAMLAGSLAARPITLAIFGPRVPSYYLLLSFASLILICIANLPRTYLRALEASAAVVTLESCGIVLSLSLNIFFIAYLKIGLVGILISSLASNLLQALVLSGWVLRKVGICFNAALLRRMIAFGLPLIFSNLAAFTMNFSDRFFLQHFRSLEVVGIYAVGYKFGFMLNYLLVQPFCAMWEPRRYIIFNQPNHPTVFSQIFTLYSLVLAYVWLGMSLFSPEIVHVMVGREFASSQDVIPIVAMAYVLWGIGYHAHLGMVLMNKTKMIGLISIGAVVVNLCLNYTFIHAWGMLGAAWSTLLSFLGIATASFWFSQRVLPLPLHARRVVCGVAIAVGLYLLSHYWRPGPIAVVLLFKACLLAAYPVLLWKGRILSADEISTLAEARDHLLARFSRQRGGVAAKGKVA